MTHAEYIGNIEVGFTYKQGLNPVLVAEKQIHNLQCYQNLFKHQIQYFELYTKDRFLCLVCSIPLFLWIVVSERVK